MSKLLSIIVPVYNTEKYLHECVDSLINQTYKNLEIILVDDGATDSSGKICDEYAALDERVKVIHQKNTGQGGARNHGLRVSKGEYITFVDSDDYVVTEAFENCMKAIELENFDYLVFRSFRNGFGGNGSGKLIPNDTRGMWESAIKYEGTLAWGVVMKKSLWDGIFYPEHQKFEDSVVSYRILERVKKSATIDKEYYYYRNNINGTCNTAGINPKARYDYILAGQDRLEYAIAHDVGVKEARAALLKSVMSYLTAFYSISMDKDDCYYKAASIFLENRDKEYDASLLNGKYKIYLWCFGRANFVHYIGAKFSYWSKIVKRYWINHKL